MTPVPISSFMPSNVWTFVSLIGNKTSRSCAVPRRNTPLRAARSIKRASSSSSWPTWLRTTAGTKEWAARKGLGGERSGVVSEGLIRVGLFTINLCNLCSSLYPSLQLDKESQWCHTQQEQVTGRPARKPIYKCFLKHSSQTMTTLLLWPLCLQII